MKRFAKVLLVVSLMLMASGLMGCKKKPPTITAAPPPSAPATSDEPPPPAASPTIDLSASPTSIQRGAQTTLQWTTTNASSVIIDNGVGNVSARGSIAVSPRESTTYTAEARGAGGDARDSVRVTVVPRPVTPASVSAADLFDELVASGQIQPVFFAYDKADLTEESRQTLQGNARVFREHPEFRLIIIEGHCDERGTEEYNLALGDRRSQAAREYLIQLGVEPERLEGISYGEERPFVQGSNEAAWAKNRRAHFRFGN